jgi:hypothetical protein
MNQAVEILTELKMRGVTVEVEGENPFLKPRAGLDEELLARIREAKNEILAALWSRPATCAASCYEVEPGRWIAVYE